MKTVASFATRLEADLLKGRLDAIGIRAFLLDENTVGWFWHYANLLGGIKVAVADADLQRAQDLLREIENRKTAAEASRAEDRAASAWTCPVCGAEVDGNQEICWACGTTADGEETPDFETATAPIIEMDIDPPLPIWWGFSFVICPLLFPFVLLAKLVFALPWPSSRVEEIPPGVEKDRQPGIDDAIPILRRACLAAVLALISLPVVLNVYSMWLIVKHRLLRAEVRQRAGWLVYTTLVINAVVLLAAAGAAWEVVRFI